MTIYCLDTSVLIDFALAHEPALSTVLGLLAGANDVGISAVQVAEFLAGVKPKDRVYWWQFLRELAYWDISLAAAMQAGIYRYAYARQGRTLSTQDTLIAAIARVHNATVVTGNVKDFPMPDVRLLPVTRT